MPRFSDEALKALKESEWYPGRKIDTTEIEAALSAQGFTIFPAAIQFWQEFDGIEYVCRYSDKMVYGIQFDAMGVAELGFHKFKPYIHKLGRPLCPIGEQDFEIFLIDPAGRVYGTQYHTIGLYSNSADEFIENWAKGRDANWIDANRVWKKAHRSGPKLPLNIWDLISRWFG